MVHRKPNYHPGSLLLEWQKSLTGKTLIASYIVVSMDIYEATLWCVYDKSDYFQPNQIIEMYHDDLHRNTRSFTWTVK